MEINLLKKQFKNGAKIIISQERKENLNNNILYLYNSNPRKLLSEISSKINKKSQII